MRWLKRTLCEPHLARSLRAQAIAALIKVFARHDEITGQFQFERQRWAAGVACWYYADVFRLPGDGGHSRNDRCGAGVQGLHRRCD